MSSPQSDTTRLVLTAVGASFAGAALAIVAMSRMIHNKGSKDDATEDSNMWSPLARNRNSFIYEDSADTGNMMRSSSSSVLFPHNHEEKMRRLVTARAAVEDENSQPRQSVTVRVPATSANMGPGCEYPEML
jgi:homoserine kinase